MATTTSIRPTTGFTAAQSVVLRQTGNLMSHGAAVHHLRGATALGRMQLQRISDATIRAAMPPISAAQTPAACQTGCNHNCNQGRRCACSGAPIDALRPKPINTRPNAFEQCLSDFGALDLNDPEGYPGDAEIDAAMTRRDIRAAGAWRWVWRIAAVGMAAIAVAALTGCGGGDDADRFEPALAMPQGVALVGDALPGLPTAGRQYVAVINRVGAPGTGAAAAHQSGADCEAAKQLGRQICVIVTTAADGEGAQIGKWLTAANYGAVYCDLTAPKADTAALLTRCAADAAAMVRAL